MGNQIFFVAARQVGRMAPKKSSPSKGTRVATAAAAAARAAPLTDQGTSDAWENSKANQLRIGNKFLDAVSEQALKAKWGLVWEKVPEEYAPALRSSTMRSPATCPRSTSSRPRTRTQARSWEQRQRSASGLPSSTGARTASKRRQRGQRLWYAATSNRKSPLPDLLLPAS